MTFRERIGAVAAAVRGRSGSRGSGEDGQVLVMVMAFLIIALLLGAAGLADALSSGRLTTHDMRVRRAQQAADAGVQAQLYDQAESNAAASYNFSGGILGLSGFLDCTVPQLNVSLQVVGVSAYASSAGVCPPALSSTGTPASSSWTALDNDAFYESEFFSNKREIGSGFGSVVEFPEIESIGCNTTSAATCSQGASTNAYARELALLAPTGPEQSIEGMHDVTINGLGVLGLGAALINGDVIAGHNLNLPALSVDLNTNGVGGSGLGSILPTFGYGNTYSGLVSTANLVHLTGGYCTAGVPSSSCMIKRPAVTITTTSCSACATGITFSGTGNPYNAATDTFSMSTGTVDLAPGDYVFCNFSATGGTINAPYSTGSPSGPVRIFILPPNSSTCAGQAGDFTASQGINNVLTGSVNGVTGALDPSGLQIYVAGDGSYDGNTTVNIGDSSSCTSHNILDVCLAATAPTEYMTVYAPTSNVTLNTGTCVVGVLGSCVLGVAGLYEGSLIGYNVNVTAAAVTQDLDIANNPLYSGVNQYQVAQYVQCDTSVKNLSNSSSDTSGC